MTFVIIPNGTDRPFKPVDGINSCLIFATEQDAKDYGASSSQIHPASAYGIYSPANVRVKHLSEDDCTFEFKHGDVWI